MSSMYSLLRTLKELIPEPVRSAYHFMLAFLAAAVFGFPSRRLLVIGVTGTKGKSSTIEYLNAIFEAAGYTTALASSIRNKVADHSEPNRMRMTMAGRFFMQRFFDQALRAGCSVVFIEMTSEGARQFRHRWIELDGLIFTNLAPEHIESHGSLSAYADAKFEIGRQLARSKKPLRVMVAHADDAQSGRFLTLPVERTIPVSLSLGAPYTATEAGGTFTFGDTDMRINFPGEFSIQNALAASALARAFDIKPPIIQRGLAALSKIPGRAERIEEGQSFAVIVDYAHTPDSLKSIYGAYPNRRRICVLGATGGGRDMWKRPVMGAIADEFCDHIVVTNEDPYDEDPRGIMESLARGMKKNTPDMIIDRREAMHKAFSIARSGDVVLVTGKGTDPSMCGPRGTQVPWSDAEVAREEIKKLLATKTTAL